MGCLPSTSRYSEDGASEHVHSSTSTKVEFEETSFTESEAHAQMIIIDVKDGQVESADCLRGLKNTVERDPDEGKAEREETGMSEIETQLTSCSPFYTTTSDAPTHAQSGAWPTAKSVTLSMAESKDARYWVQDLKG